MQPATQKQYFKKIEEAANDGLNGSRTYALDRLILIREMAQSALRRLEADR